MALQGKLLSGYLIPLFTHTHEKKKKAYIPYASVPMLIYLEELNTMVIKIKKDIFLHHWYLIPQTNALEPVRVKAPCALAADVSCGRKPLTHMKGCRYKLESCGKLCPLMGSLG